jgi:hypothetical protein
LYPRNFFQWLTPVVLATQEAEIKRIAVQSQPGQIVLETLSRKKPITKKGLAGWRHSSSGRVPDTKKGWWSGSKCRL